MGASYSGFIGGRAIATGIIGGDPGIRFGGGGNKYKVQKDLLDVTSSGPVYARDTEPYVAMLMPAAGKTIDTVIVSMGGVDITSTAWKSAASKIVVDNVIGPIDIVASAVETPDSIDLEDVDSSFRTKLTEVVASVNASGQSEIAFAVITDPHSANPSVNKSQNIARYLLKNSKANKLFMLGDYCTTNWSTPAWESFAEPLLNCAEKVYVTLGNHEYFGSTAAGLATIRSDFVNDKTNLTGSTTNFYYYLDDAVHKVRYILINTSETMTNHFSSTQLAWLQGAVQLPTSEWKIIAMSHFPVYRPSEGGEMTSNEQVSEGRLAIRDALLSTNGTVIAYLCGHIHADLRHVVDYSFYEQILNCDTNGTAVTVFNVNLETGIVNEYRIGNRGEDMSFDYDDLPEMVTRTVTNTLTGCTTNNNTTSLINGRPYTATLTPDLNYDLSTGTITITMGELNITQACYNAETRVISVPSVQDDLSIVAVAEYVAPVTEFTADWFTKGTNRRSLNFPANIADLDIDAEFPQYFAVICAHGGSAYETGFRNSTYAAYGSRTTSWTAKYWNLIDSTGTDGKKVFNTTTLPTVSVNGRSYCYHTFTRADHNAAFAARQTAIAGGQIAQTGAIVVTKSNGAGGDIWVLDQNVTADNVKSIIKRLPAHLLKIIATFNQGDHVVYTTDTLDSLKQYLLVQEQWTYNVLKDIADSDYTLSGTLEEGTSTITVTYGELTATFTVTVTAA